MRTLVMGDIHGAHKALVQCLEKSGFNMEHDRLIQLGDIPTATLIWFFNLT
jgi:serine/threonine protein phosphatase 1